MNSRTMKLALLHRILLASTASVALFVSPAAPASGPAITNVQVNQAFPGHFITNRQREPSLAQNPTNPLNLVAGSVDFIGELPCTNATPSICVGAEGVSRVGFYASFDGGVTWPYQGLIDLSAYGYYAFSDPVQTFDSQGNAYFSMIAFKKSDDNFNNTGAIFVAKSTDGGRTYSTATRASGDALFLFTDKEWV